MKAANFIKKNNPVILRGRLATPSQALKYAWWFEKFRSLLATGIYRFSYIKKDTTEIREAIGTLNEEYIPLDKLPGTSSRKTGGVASAEKGEPNYDVFTYFDLQKNAWRSFRLDNFIGFVEELQDASVTALPSRSA